MRPLARTLGRVGIFALILGVAAARARADGGAPQGPPASAQSELETLLGDPTNAEWAALSRFDGTITRADFERRLENPFDPSHGLAPFLRITDSGFQALASASDSAAVLAVVRFATAGARETRYQEGFRSPRMVRAAHAANSPPLAGLRVAIEPADIGGKWAEMEDRSVNFRGYGQINEGDLNLLVAWLLRDELASMGSTVFLVRDRAEPVLSIPTDQAVKAAEDILSSRADAFPHAFQYKEAPLAHDNPATLRIAAGLLVTKNAETRARATRVRQNFSPDVTVVLQFDATPGSSQGRLASANRNIFFVEGAYTPGELAQPEQRFRLLTKALEGVTPIETEVAAAIAERFQARTGYPPVFYGDSPTTRLVLPGNAYVVARNLAFNREHDGPVVVTEPYLMNQADTLARLVAGDYAGERMVAGRPRRSIFREYADCVAEGMVEAYWPRPGS
jgi:hypothetical protein